MREELDDLAALVAGSKPAWDRFVERYAGLIVSAIRRVIGPGGEVDEIGRAHV